MTVLQELRRSSLDAYCTPHSDFFDHPGRSDSGGRFEPAATPPPGWRRVDDDSWLYHVAPTPMPDQGWKIHAAATPGNAQYVLDTCAEYAFERGVSFKHLRSPALLRVLNGKLANRASSGKFVTFYPADEDELFATLDELGGRLDGTPAPYVLNDLRWRGGPLHVRYGGFRHLECSDASGHAVPAVRRPDGVLVPDSRVPWFDVPDWVRVPESIERMRTEGAVPPPAGYTFTEAMHFSNGGGVYRGRRERDGLDVVLKEARPHAGLDGGDRDAVERLRAERDALQALSGLEGVPDLVDAFRVWEHDFIVLPYYPHPSVEQLLATEHPGLFATADAAADAAYVARVCRMLRAVEAVVDRIHARGWIFGDLHPANVLVRDDDSVVLIDYELARRATETALPGLGCPGFIRSRRGKAPLERADDSYALACLFLWCFLPLTEMANFSEAKLGEYVAWAETRFELPAWWSRRVREGLGITDAGAPAPALDVQSLDVGIRSTLTPESDDRLVPGDVLQFVSDPVHLAAGAAGAVWALDQCGSAPADAVDWLRERTHRATRFGLYDGAAGVASALYSHDRRAAEALIEAAVERAAVSSDPTVFSGRAGVGLLALALADDQGVPAAEALATGLDGLSVSAADSPTGHVAGYIEGWAGPAVFLARLGLRTNDACRLEQARECIRRDVAACEWGPGDALLAREGAALFPYLSHGSAGALLAHVELLAGGVDGVLTDTEVAGIVRGLSTELVIEPGLLTGRAGNMAVLDLVRRHTGMTLDDTIAGHRARLAWHGVPRGEGSLVPGRRLRRLSADLATGASGVMAVLHALDTCGDAFPFATGRTLR